ncbi:hypothetical protein [Sphingobium sp. WCS2017Hpa-17]|uniref:hypothetical protein n=1 Tax=Sphingobium sp. WCS2017Hpa-17 TaxID=3073638 RepID=UPI00288AE791|nr:hypothetical protein [Sphingobium sp. WCS2017Hpa-17]
MNLRGIANRATTRINRNLPAEALICQGYGTAASGKRTAIYADPVAITAQVQALTKDEIRHLDAQNIAGTEMAAYVNRQLTSIDRDKGSGGDVVLFGDQPTVPVDLRGSAWVVTAVLEAWTTAGWSRVGLTRQMSS